MWSHFIKTPHLQGVFAVGVKSLEWGIGLMIATKLNKDLDAGIPKFRNANEKHALWMNGRAEDSYAQLRPGHIDPATGKRDIKYHIQPNGLLQVSTHGTFAISPPRQKYTQYVDNLWAFCTVDDNGNVEWKGWLTGWEVLGYEKYDWKIPVD